LTHYFAEAIYCFVYVCALLEDW